MSSAQLSVIIRFSIKPEQRDFFLQEIKKAIPPIRQQEGCLQVFLHENADKPNNFIVLHTWASQEHWRAHLHSPVAGELALLGNSITTDFSMEKMQLQNM